MNPIFVNSKAPPVTDKDSSFQFASLLAHEIRNPLTNINLSIKMLELALKDNELKKYLDILMRSAVRINDLLNELLTCKQAEESRIEKYSVHQLLDEVLDMANDRVLLKKITVIKDYDIQDLKIVLNRAGIKIALTNIIINAIDAMSEENGELKIVTRSKDNGLVLQIEDNGCGISNTNLKNIFTPYYTNKEGGLGLGLSTTYNVLQSNKIGISVESEVGKGTKFILSFEKKNNTEFIPIAEKFLTPLTTRPMLLT